MTTAIAWTPQPGEPAPCGEAAWRAHLARVALHGQPVEAVGTLAAGGEPTRELLHQGILAVDLARPQVTSPARKLSTRFMAAEALWVLDGQNDVATVAAHAPSIIRFSDDGTVLAGAYGPPFVAQAAWVVRQLRADPLTRQAVLTLWARCPLPSKDIPCTVAMTFSIRRGRLHQHVYMRSSDVWLGVPYDLFTFACMGLWIACGYNHNLPRVQQVLPGVLTVSITSAHLYRRNQAAAEAVLATPYGPSGPAVPDELLLVGLSGRDYLRADLTLVAAGHQGISWQVVP